MRAEEDNAGERREPDGREQLPDGALLISLLGVRYVHGVTPDRGDLYVMAPAIPFWNELQPENWFEPGWFEAHRVRLPGTSAVYAVPTRPVDGRSLKLVVKYCRVGQHVPLETRVLYEVLQAEFNGPFEEFSLVDELRRSRRGGAGPPIRFQSPLAIYVPPERLQLWQTGRSESRIAGKLARYPGVAIDILRDYILVYEWLEGIDAAEASQKQELDPPTLEALTRRAMDEMGARGFRVLDMKPEHVIVRFDAPGKPRRRPGTDDIEYGLVDFELLERTPEYESEVQSSRQREYHRRQHPGAAAPDGPPELPPHLHAAAIFGVDYVYGRVESTGGALWVTGRDPALFDYFLPERWRQTHRIQLDPEHETYYTRTRDHVHLVWKVSRVGEPQDSRGAGADDRRALEHGVNSPFEEFALAHRLGAAGVRTIVPQAIYMTGHQSNLEDRTLDWRRYRTHERFLMPDGEPVLRTGRNYITLWSYGGGPGRAAGADDEECDRAVNGDEARDRGLLTAASLSDLLVRFAARLNASGVEVLNLLPRQILLELDHEGRLVRNERGEVDPRLCSFDFLRLRLPESGPDAGGFVPPGVSGEAPTPGRVDLHRLLAARRDELAGNTLNRILASGAPHYAMMEEAEVRQRIDKLVDAMLDALRTNWRALVTHVRGITEERIDEGYHLGEVQLALDCLEDEIWRRCVAEVADRHDLLSCLKSVTGIVGRAKDELARAYLERKQQGDVTVHELEERLKRLLGDTDGGTPEE